MVKASEKRMTYKPVSCLALSSGRIDTYKAPTVTVMSRAAGVEDSTFNAGDSAGGRQSVV